MIASGHGAAAWDYTPRRALAFAKLVTTRQKREAADRLTINALAARGDAQQLKKLQADLIKGD